MNWKEQNLRARYVSNLECIKFCEKRIREAKEGTDLHRMGEIELLFREFILEDHLVQASELGMTL